MRQNLPFSWQSPQRWLRQWPQRRFLRRTAVDAGTLDYRDRISVVTWVLVFGLGLSLLLEIPTTQVTLIALGSPMTLPLSAGSMMALFLAVVAAAGTESIVRLHPSYVRRLPSATWASWALPMAIAIISVVLLPQVPTRLLQVVVLLTAGAILAAALYSLYATVERGQPGFRRARLMLDALAYGAALLLFLFVYETRTRSLMSGTLVAMTATLLAIEILRTSTSQSLLVLIYGAVVGILLGEVTWALNYWPLLPELTGSLLLLLSFYLAVGIAQQALQGRLTRRVVVEFGLFGLFALVLIVVFGPGF